VPAEPCGAYRGEKPTRERLDQRINRVVDMLRMRVPKSGVKALLKKEYGVTGRTCETYVARARRRILEKGARAGVSDVRFQLAKVGCSTSFRDFRSMQAW
jgi:hypothetical protein